MPQRREREQCQRDSGLQLPSLPPCICPYQRPHPNPKTDVPDNRPQPSVPVHKSTPWPGAGKVSGNLFEERNWLLPQHYLDNDNRNENEIEDEHKNVTSVTSPRPPIKEEKDPKMSEQSIEKCSWGPDCPFYKYQEKKEEENKAQQ